jgi:4-hydroxy-3-methylbut-2-enyl diphosphate reductase
MDREDSSPKMGLQVEVDSKSGFCYGVIKAVRQAENFLKNNSHIYSLGAIVHNDTELARLENLGMKIIQHSDIERIEDVDIFIRAHGEPPSTYKRAAERGLVVMDCTCPVVLKLQERIRKGYRQVKERGGTLLIFGKKGHAEVNGLIGQVDGDAVIIEREEDLNSIDFSRALTIFSQTTMDTVHYSAIISSIKRRVSEAGGDSGKFEYHNTICRQVSSRHPHLRLYCGKHNVIIFVSGGQSSNGRVLFETCRSVNARTYKIESSKDLNISWFNPGETVGVCGATSTPMWQLNEIAEIIRNY